MKLKLSIAIILTSLLFVSCGSKKKVVTSNRKVVVEQKEEMPEIPQLEQIKKRSITTPKNTNEYILKFALIAVKKMHEHNIPASITLAQGILESGSGRSALAIRSNNHFGIKCHRGWKGKSVTHDDDEKGECFRKYKYPESSYEDHSQFLLTRKRYSNLFRLKRTDYKGWAYGLKRAGYATDKRYPQKLISLIHKYDLMKYDRVRASKKKQKGKGSYYEVKKGDTLYSIARRHKISVKLLKEINGIQSNQISIGQELLVQ
ncbi:Flagellum-specific peptidoglycan hydrolase FlgJ [Tenacibaculum sp. MAR_2009_124]|uniref:glucosaminidase domain-containing protein n=1 Tax=Tenacibaculum sp. MAR_2009_124 TaxID=1250059 RepID=UPI0008984272|nr:glucosaminidase domain-containing protein [Tenacibaculum sp. MAR_2009_124]SED07231.1 Flagellum-specific peptidoglycan hydrolase FlgJ [Tenacibaculum sp. MAR_2009_124]